MNGAGIFCLGIEYLGTFGILLDFLYSSIELVVWLMQRPTDAADNLCFFLLLELLLLWKLSYIHFEPNLLRLFLPD